MPQLPRHMRIRRSQSRLLVKKRHFLKNYPVIKSCKLLCKELQSNNNTLAKALSKEKQESQMLFSQNIGLLSEVQDLTVARNKRDTVISNILNNSKEMLQMLVAVTGYLTNTISCCQEFIRSVPTNMRMSCSSVGRRDSMRRLSLRSPTRGVVKPMVSGHTITKPTINLSRVNMRHINNSSNLSIIPEVSTPPRNQELNNSVSARQRRSNNGRVCRMPERLAVTSPRDNDEHERRLSERSNRYSGRISGRLSQSKSRLSRNSRSQSSIENFESIRSPRVKLNDVSKLLQNSQSINIRMLTESQNNQENNSPENSDDVNQEEETVVPDTPPADGFKTDNDRNKVNGAKNKRRHRELDTTKQHERRNVNARKYCTPHYEDPLEGPSWLFDDSRVVPSFTSKEKKTDDVDASNDDNMSMTLKTTDSSDASDDEGRATQQMSPLPTSNRVNGCKKNKEMNDQVERSMVQQTENNDTVSNITTTDTNENVCNDEDTPVAADVVSFVTQRRGCFESEDDDDYTLMFPQKPRNLHFDINDLILPVLEQSVLKPMAPVETEPEVTSTLRKISQICPVPSASHNTLDESTFNQSTVKLPLLINNDYNDNESTPMAKKSEYLQQKRKSKKTTSGESNDFDDSPPFKKKNIQKKRKNRPVKDPSAAKVVLEKLDETEVKSRTPSPKMNETESREFSQSLSSLHASNLSDSDSNASSNSQYMSNRPRRRRAPTTFAEPNLRMKLRRN